MSSIEELEDEIKHLEQRAENFFEGPGPHHYGDRGYQDIMSDIYELECQIEELKKE